MRVTDDDRILVTLRDGGTVQNYYKSGYGWSNPPIYYCSVGGPEGDERFRLVSKKALNRCESAGWIVASGTKDCWGHDLTYALTESGIKGAAELAGTLDDAVRAPKPPSEASIARKKAEREAKERADREERELSSRRYYASEAFQSIYGTNRRMVRSRNEWRVCAADQPFDPDYFLNGVVKDEGLLEISHLLEEFDGIDGRPSFRVIADGLDLFRKWLAKPPARDANAPVAPCA